MPISWKVPRMRVSGVETRALTWVEIARNIVCLTAGKVASTEQMLFIPDSRSNQSESQIQRQGTFYDRCRNTMCVNDMFQ